jgi:diaminopimelate decarboxylase
MPDADVPHPKRIAKLSSTLLAAADRFGTPTYVMDMATLEGAAGDVEAAFRPPWVLQYSLKANDLPAISSFLHKRGWGGNVVSTGEWQFARHGGIPNSAITFEGIGKTDAQLEFAVVEAAHGRPIRWLAVESAQEADRLAVLSERHQLGRAGRAPLDLLLRLNPQVNPETRAEFAVGRAASKFGMTDVEILALVRGGLVDRPGLRLRGIHVHTGSDLKDVGAWADAGLRATRLLAELASLEPTADTVDYGGGFPQAAPSAPSPARFLAALTEALAGAGLPLPPRPSIEPGRFLVGRAGWLVTSVLHARPTPAGGGTALTVIDAGMTELIRPALYGSHHRAYALPLDRWHPDSVTASSLHGPICESTDTFGIHQLPPLRRGDIVALEDAGAYGASFTSRYNGRPAPVEVALWPDGSLERFDRPAIVASAPQANPVPAMAW